MKESDESANNSLFKMRDSSGFRGKFDVLDVTQLSLKASPHLG